MRILVITKKRLARYLLIACSVIAGSILLVVLLTSGIIIAFAPEKELPIYSVERADRVCAITFDCAWGSDDIPDILATLRKEDIKATFFIVGQWAEKFPDQVKAIAAEGHDIANHSYSHLRMGAIDRNKIKTEITQCSTRLNQITGNKIDLFRAPYGDYSNDVVGVAKSLGYFPIQWSVDSLDWKPEISASDISDRILKRIRPGSIILFHNGTVHTARILPSIIASLKNEGYEFIPVSKLIIRDNYFIDFEGRQKPKTE